MEIKKHLKKFSPDVVISLFFIYTAKTLGLFYRELFLFIRLIFWPFKIVTVYICRLVFKLAKRFRYELAIAFHLMAAFISLFVIVFFPSFKRSIEEKNDKEFYTFVKEALAEEIYKADIWPFRQFQQYENLIEAKDAELVDYKIKAGEQVEAIEVTLRKEAKKVGVPFRVVKGILANENSKKDPNAFFAKNKNGTLDTGVMQVNSSNFEYCKITTAQAFNAVYNIRCGMKILRNAYRQAADLAMQRKKPASCTGASKREELQEEYTARIYNGGPNVFAKGDTSCEYARSFRIALGARIINVREENEQVAVNEEEEEKKSFWSRIF